MPMPELPINVPTDQRQVDGTIDSDPVYQTHRGPKKPKGEHGLPPYAPKPDVPLRYAEE